MNNSQATLDWQNGQPISRIYGDVYFSRESGLQETQHVFLAQNRLQERWQALKNGRFTIAETGFGTGLNFLCAWQLWNESAPRSASMHFVSTEKYPLSHADLAQALDLWPQLANLRDQLSAQYQVLTQGWHRLVFEHGRVTLTLIIGDARETLPQLRASVDAWFLDGFAPAKNPEMWQQALFDNMARLSHAATTFATFTSAGEVRRGLQAAGFEVKKVAGFGRKREMLCGQYKGASCVIPAEAGIQLFNSGSRVVARDDETALFNPKLPNAIVIGGGIAGTATSRALASRGWQVTLIERHPALAQEASGNPLGVLYPRLAGQDMALSRLALHGYLHTTRLLQQLNLDPHDYGACGLLQLAFDAQELARCKAIAARNLPAELLRYVDADEASRLAGVALTHEGLYFPAAGWVNPPAFCNALADHENISLMPSVTALRLQRDGEQWQVWDEKRLLAQAPVVILASANDTVNFEQSMHLPLEPVRGQITMLPANAGSQKLKMVVCTDGYVSPAVAGIHCVGATFSPNDVSNDIRLSDHATNLAMLRRMSPELYQSLSQQLVSGRVALRCATPDYLPMAGPLLDSAALSANPPRYNADPATLPWLTGLYVNTGHGSKGLINAPLCAEMIACAINGEPAPVDVKLLAALDPNRFMLRKLGLKRLVQGLAAYPLM
jgi:tRNA 5-methylaminomethyl-2-thiouridine biosynthesis bifunctional protein